MESPITELDMLVGDIEEAVRRMHVGLGTNALYTDEGYVRLLNVKALRELSQWLSKDAKRAAPYRTRLEAPWRTFTSIICDGAANQLRQNIEGWHRITEDVNLFLASMQRNGLWEVEQLGVQVSDYCPSTLQLAFESEFDLGGGRDRFYWFNLVSEIATKYWARFFAYFLAGGSTSNFAIDDAVALGIWGRNAGSDATQVVARLGLTHSRILAESGVYESQLTGYDRLALLQTARLIARCSQAS